MDAPWRIELLGRLSARQDGRVIRRFRTQKTGALFAYLAYYRDRPHPREELIELFWPEDAAPAARNSLRVSLTSLRRQLEGPGIPAGAILIADRANVQLNPAACLTDVAEFEKAFRASAEVESAAARVQLLRQAVDLYQGELLPGYYEDWILPERDRLAEAYLSALRRLVKALAQARDFERAIGYARRAVSADPLREESHRNLMRLYAAIGQPYAALNQYADLERVLKAEIGVVPTAATRDLAEQLSRLVAAGPTLATLPVDAAPPLEEAAPRRARTQSSPSSLTARNTPEAVSEIDLPTLSQMDISPPALPTAEQMGSLPLQFTHFFGREEEIAKLQALLQPEALPETETDGKRRARLITLIGPGGNGKTRLAIEVADRLRDTFPAGAWFVPLADLTHARQIAGAIRDTLHLPRSPGVEPLDQVIDRLTGLPALLVLDNFEHLAAGGAALVLTLLSRVPALTCLVTSRRRLALACEHKYPVRPLPTPGGEDTPERLAQLASVQLFLDRAQIARPDFQITVRNAADIAALCRSLEGIPLALELAAARALVLSPAQMRARLAQRFELLATGRADKASRHRSVWAAIDWSYHLLAPPLQRLFTRLSVFRGGWSLEAAETVCEEPLALDYLSQLQGHSLIFAEESSTEMRFRMLETLREYAEEQLGEEDHAALARRHARYFCALAEEAKPHLTGPEQALWLDRLDTDYDNLRVALDWCRTMPDGIAMGLRTAVALWQFWSIRGLAGEGTEQLEGVLARADDSIPAPLRAQALRVAGNLADIQGNLTVSRVLCEQSLALQRALGDEHGVAVQLNNLAILADQQGDYAQAHACSSEALALLRRIADKPGIARTLSNLGVITRHQGDSALARECYTQSLAIYRQMEDHLKVAIVLHNLGVVLSDLGEHTEARTLLEESIAIRRKLGDRRGIAHSLGPLAILAAKQEDFARAHALYVESLRLFSDLQDRSGALRCLDGLAETLIHLGQSERAARLLGVVEAQRGLSDMTWSPQEQAELAQAIAAAQTALGEKQFTALFTQAREMTLEQAIACALEQNA